MKNEKEKYVQELMDWVDTQSIFTGGYDHRSLPGGGFVTWDRREVVAVSPPALNPLEAIAFFRVVEILLPQGWSGDPEIRLLSDGRISIRGIAD